MWLRIIKRDTLSQVWARLLIVLLGGSSGRETSRLFQTEAASGTVLYSRVGSHSINAEKHQRNVSFPLRFLVPFSWKVTILYSGVTCSWHTLDQRWTNAFYEEPEIKNVEWNAALCLTVTFFFFFFMNLYISIHKILKSSLWLWAASPGLSISRLDFEISMNRAHVWTIPLNPRKCLVIVLMCLVMMMTFSFLMNSTWGFKIQ